MVWSREAALQEALNKLVKESHAPEHVSAKSFVVDSNRAYQRGVYAGGQFATIEADGEKKHQAQDAELDINGVASAYKAGLFTKVNSENSFFQEHGDHLAIDGSVMKLYVYEVITTPNDDANGGEVVDDCEIVLRFKYPQSAGGGNGFEFFNANAVFQISSRMNRDEYLNAFYEALLSMKVDGRYLISADPHNEFYKYNKEAPLPGSTLDTLFSAWVDTDNASIFIASSSPKNSSFNLVCAAVTNNGTVLFPNEFTYYHDRGHLRTNAIRDVSFKDASAMRLGTLIDGAQGVAFDENGEPHEYARQDIDIQGVRVRSKQGAEQIHSKVMHQYEGGPGDVGYGPRFEPEVIAHGVHRTVQIEITPQLLRDYNLDSNAQGGGDFFVFHTGFPNQNVLDIERPYLLEGTPILVDAFLEIEESFLTMDQNGDVIPLSMDFGCYSTHLMPHGSAVMRRDYNPFVSQVVTKRDFTSSILRGVDVSEVRRAVSRQGTSSLPASSMFYEGQILITERIAGKEQFWFCFNPLDKETLTFNGIVPSIGPFCEDIVVQSLEIEYQHAEQSHAALDQRDTLANPGAQGGTAGASIYVSPPGVDGLPGNYYPVHQMLDYAASMYAWENGGSVFLNQWQGSTPGSKYYQNNLGFRLPAGWKMAVGFRAEADIIPTGTLLKAVLNARRCSSKGIGILGNQATQISGSRQVAMVFGMLHRKAPLEIDGIVPLKADGTRGYESTIAEDVENMTHGKAFLHLHYWQAKERTPFRKGGIGAVGDAGGGGGATDANAESSDSNTGTGDAQVPYGGAGDFGSYGGSGYGDSGESSSDTGGDSGSTSAGGFPGYLPTFDFSPISISQIAIDTASFQTLDIQLAVELSDYILHDFSGLPEYNAPVAPTTGSGTKAYADLTAVGFGDGAVSSDIYHEMVEGQSTVSTGTAGSGDIWKILAKQLTTSGDGTQHTQLVLEPVNHTNPLSGGEVFFEALDAINNTTTWEQLPVSNTVEGEMWTLDGMSDMTLVQSVDLASGGGTVLSVGSDLFDVNMVISDLMSGGSVNSVFVAAQAGSVFPSETVFDLSSNTANAVIEASSGTNQFVLSSSSVENHLSATQSASDTTFQLIENSPQMVTSLLAASQIELTTLQAAVTAAQSAAAAALAAQATAQADYDTAVADGSDSEAIANAQQVLDAANVEAANAQTQETEAQTAQANAQAAANSLLNLLS